MLLHYATAIAFIMEYIKYREKDWNSIRASALTNWFLTRPNPENRKNQCEEIKKLLVATAIANEAEAPEKLIRIIGQIAKIARETQAAQLSNKDSYLVGYFTSDNSLFAKILHAIRTILVIVLKERFKPQYDAQIIKMKEELEKKNKIIDCDLKVKLDISNLKKERNEIYNQLLDLQDESTIEDACKNDKFPSFLPSSKSTNSKSDPNIPDVYCERYYNVYFKTEIQVNSDRQVCYIDEVKKITHFENQLKEENADILNEGSNMMVSKSEKNLRQHSLNNISINNPEVLSIASQDDMLTEDKFNILGISVAAPQQQHDMTETNEDILIPTEKKGSYNIW